VVGKGNLSGPSTAVGAKGLLGPSIVAAVQTQAALARVEVVAEMADPPGLASIVETIQAAMGDLLVASAAQATQIVQRYRTGSLLAPAKVVPLEESQQSAPSSHNNYKIQPHLEVDSHSNDIT
jgi:hypothetical protein